MEISRHASAHSGLFGTSDSRSQPRCAVVVAHPNHEIVVAGALISKLSEVTVLHITDGAPHDWRELQNSSFKTAANYAQVRREECLAALKVAEVSQEHVLDLHISDQEASHDLVELAKKILRFLLQSSPDIVLTHPYEGGHPDHDATAFATHMAIDLMKQRGIKPPIVFEVAL